MMTLKQKWFIHKLLKEIEDEYGVDIWMETIFGSNQFDMYKTTIKEASGDIGMLLKAKENLANGKEWFSGLN